MCNQNITHSFLSSQISLPRATFPCFCSGAPQPGETLIWPGPFGREFHGSVWSLVFCRAGTHFPLLSQPGGCTELLLEPLSAALLTARGAGILPCGTAIIIPAGTGNQAESFSGPLSTVHNYLPKPAQGYISAVKEWDRFLVANSSTLSGIRQELLNTHGGKKDL